MPVRRNDSMPPSSSSTVRRMAIATLALTAAALLCAVLAPAGARAAGGSGTLAGIVPQRGMTVELMAATPGAKAPTRLGTARSGKGGVFVLSYADARPSTVDYLLASRPGGGAEAGFPIYGQSYRLGRRSAKIGPPRRP